MIRKLRIFLRENRFCKETIYPVVFSLMNRIGWKSFLVRTYGANALKKIQNAALEQGITCSPYFGTLLGLVREHRLLKHDADMDFLIPPSEVGKLSFFDKLIKYGFKPERVILINNYVGEVSFRYREINIDFMLVGVNRAKTRYVRVVHDRDEFRVHSYPIISSMQSCKTYYGDVLIPINAERHLENEYGQWRVQNKSWDARRGPSFRCVLNEIDGETPVCSELRNIKDIRAILAGQILHDPEFDV